MSAEIRQLGGDGELSPSRARALRSAMMRCADFPTYARMFREAGLDARELASADPLAALRRLPIIGADELNAVSREALAMNLAIVDAETSSGSAGGKKTRFITYEDDRAEHRFLARLLAVCGVRETDRIACVDTDPAAVMVSFLKAGEILGAAECCAVGVGARFDTAADALGRLRPSVLISVPSIIERTLDAAPGLIPDSIRKIIYIGEGMSAATKSRAEAAFGARAYSYYGASETSALGIECEARNGVHLFGERHIFETEPDESAPDDDRWRLIVTTLAQEGLPLLRYRLGDIIRERDGRCPCGLADPRVDILGRPEMVASVLGSKIHHAAIQATMQRAGMRGALQIILETDGETDGAATDIMRLIIPEINAHLADAALTAILREHEDLEFLHAGGILKIRIEPRPASHFAQDRKANKMVDLREMRE